MLEIVACALWIWGTTFAGLIGVVGQVLMIPGRLLVLIAEMLLDWIGE